MGLDDGFPPMTQSNPVIHPSERVEEIAKQKLASALKDAAPPFNLPPLAQSRRAEVRVPASIAGSDPSQGPL